jgi:branched-chain amino acid transport system ATP-binding protein
MRKMLDVENVTAYYDAVQALWDVSFKIDEREIVGIIGPNGAGKSTLVKTILGLCPASGGKILFSGERIDQLPTYKIINKGISLIPETRDIFPKMTVMDNLLLGAYANKSHNSTDLREQVFKLFPVLKAKLKKMARTLSGGEQQMLAIGRSLMSEPKLLILDEPSSGLSPIMVEKILDTISEINENGMTILLVEQNVQEALEIAHRAYVLEEGRITGTGSGSELMKDERIKEVYLGM